ncbi:MAG: sugar phosphate isomerase/epimerase family protein [Armatimonadota bacterium]
MKVGICSIIWKDRMDIFDVIDTAQRVGAEGIEVWGQAPHIPDPQDLQHVSEVAEAMKEAGLSAPQYGSYARVGSDDFFEALAADLVVAQKLNSPAMRIWAGSQDSEDTTVEQWEHLIADLREACEIVADRGVVLTLERHANTATNTLWGCQRIIDEVAHDGLKINFQTASPATSRIVEEIRILQPHILNVHAQNSTNTERGREGRSLADGDVDWAATIEALNDVGWNGFIEIEFVRRGTGELPLDELEEELAADISFIRECWEK